MHPKHMLNVGKKNHTNFTLMKLLELFIIMALWKISKKLKLNKLK